MLRESGVAFFSSLSIHSLAMALVVGINIAVCLRLLTTNSAATFPGLNKLYPLHWLGTVFIFLSGIALLIAYPAKALTNPVFYLKFAALTGGLMIAFKLQKQLETSTFSAQQFRQAKQLAVIALLLWIVTVTAGRFLAYTNSVLLASRFY